MSGEAEKTSENEQSEAPTADLNTMYPSTNETKTEDAPAEDAPADGNVKLTFGLAPGQTDAAPFTMEARLAPIDTGIPTMVGVMDLDGFQLEGVKELLPQGTMSAIGGEVIDVSAKWLLSPDSINLKAAVTTERDITNRLTITGTPDNPQIGGAEILLGILARPGALVGRLAGDALGATAGIATGAVDTAKDLASGAGKAVANLGGGLFDTGKSLLSGDLKKAGEGMKKATVGTVAAAGEGVATAAGTAGGAVAESGGRLVSGEDLVTPFVNDRVQRHKKAVEEAAEWLSAQQMP